MMRRILIILLLSLGISAAFSAEKVVQQKPVQKVVLKSDSTTNIQIRTFDTKKIATYREQKIFDYDQNIPAPNNWWTRWLSWFWEFIGRGLSNAISGTFTKYIIILILVGVITYVAIKGMGLDVMVITGRSKPVEIPYTESLDNIHKIDFNSEIEKAIANSDYRLAVRLSYLYSLKKLNDQKQIDWQPEKTNQVYISEIADAEKRVQFRQLTTLFEYIWYGEFFIDQENFSELKQRFDQFNLKLS